MHLRFRMGNPLRFDLLEEMRRAVSGMNHRLVRRIQILLAVMDGNCSYEEVAAQWYVTIETVEKYVAEFLIKGMKSLKYTRPAGRPS